MVQVNMDVDVPAGMCIVGMKAHLRVRHACTRQLQIELLGPGPVTSVTASGADGGVSASALHPDRNPESTDYSRAGGDAGATASARRYKPMESGAGSSRRSLDMPTGRARAVPLIRWRDGTSGVSTGHGSCGQDLGYSGAAPSELLVFDDDADVHIGDDSATSPFVGSYQPESPLRVFHQMPARGRWSLRMYDREVDAIEGDLLRWKLSFDLEPCSPQFQWTDLSHTVPQMLLRPRYQHTAVVVGESMFVYNGHSRGRLAADLWRYDANPARRLWTKLVTKAAAPMEQYGRALVLTPWRLLSFGGFGDHDHDHSTPSGSHDDVGHGYGRGHQIPRATRRNQELGPFDVLANDVVTDLWQRIATTGVPGRPRPRAHRGRSHLDQRGVGTIAEHQPVPRARYLSAAILVGAVGTQTRKRGVDKAKVLLFGGDDGVTHLDDMWSLDLDLMALQDGQPSEVQGREALCHWRRQVETGPAFQQWNSTCMATDAAQQTGQCNMREVLLQAWCWGHYANDWQSIHNL